MRRILSILATALVLTGLASCSNGSRKALLPNVSGKAGEVMPQLVEEIKKRLAQ